MSRRGSELPDGVGRLWAGWRAEFVESAAGNAEGGECVFCTIFATAAPGEDTLVLARNELAVALLNLYPYTSGHLMVMPVRHVADLEAVEGDEAAALWSLLSDAMRAIKAAYQPDGINVGANLGRAAGAGVPGHFHMHALPRWNGDTNFTTAIANTRVLPESLSRSYEKLVANWPA
jgi:ATP adenylyltransferase